MDKIRGEGMDGPCDTHEQKRNVCGDLMDNVKKNHNLKTQT